MAGYTKKYLLIYLAQGTSMLLGMLSLFIVTPFITSNKEVYGVYAICVSLTIFFSYADIGFLGAAQKFSAESYIRGDRKEEMAIMGFSCAVLLSLLMILSLGLLILAYRPEYLIKGISDENYHIARSLLLILACSSPIFCFQRLIQVIFSVRLADYYYQTIQIIGSLIRISSAPFFFFFVNYDIVGYYLMCQIINLVFLIISFYIAKRKFSIEFLVIIRNLKFRKTTYDLLSGLAFASLFGTICWVLYYELDNIVISKLLGAEAVAIYAIAFSILTVLRNLFGTLFGPYQTRYNYYIGMGDISGLNKFVKFQMMFFYPICVIPILVMIVLSKPFIVSWVGWAYLDSSKVLRFLLLCNILAFVSYPSGIYLTALKKLNVMYISSGIIVIVFWVGVLSLYNHIGVFAFALMKAIGMIFSALYVTFVVLKLMGDSFLSFVMQMAKSYLVPTSLCVLLLNIIAPFMQMEKGREDLLLNILVIALSGIISFFIFYLFSSLFRKDINTLVCHFKADRTT